VYHCFRSAPHVTSVYLIYVNEITVALSIFMCRRKKKTFRSEVFGVRFLVVSTIVTDIEFLELAQHFYHVI
jgi:hypothetical protein